MNSLNLQWRRWSMLGFISLAIGIFLTPWDHSLDSDVATFVKFGLTILDGGAPYRDVVDNKPPLFYLLTAAAIAAGWLAELDPSISVRLFSVISVTVASICLGLLARRYGVSRLGVGIAIIAASVIFNTTTFSGGGGFSEPPAHALALTAWVLLEYRRGIFASVLSGALFAAGLAVSFAVAPFAVILLWHLWQGRNYRAIMAFGLSAATVFVLLIAYLFLAGALTQAYDQVIVYNRVYLAINCDAYPDTRWPCSTRRFWNPLPINMILIILTGIPPLAGLLWQRVPLRLWIACGVLMVAAFVPLLRAPSGHYFWPFLVGIFPLVILGSEALLQQAWRQRRTVAQAIVMVWIISGLVSSAAAVLRAQQLEKMHNEVYALELRVLNDLQQLPADRPLFVWGFWTSAYLETNRLQASTAINSFALMVPNYTSASRVEEVCRELAKSRPIIATEGFFLNLHAGAPLPEGLPYAAFLRLEEVVLNNWHEIAHHGNFSIWEPNSTQLLDDDICQVSDQ